MRQPGPYRVGDRFGVGPQAVVAWDLHHCATRRSGRNPEPVSLTLDDQRRGRYRVELFKTARRCRLPGAARRLKREGKAKHRNRADRLRCAAGHPGAQGSTADDERQHAQLTRAHVVDRRRPGGVEVVRRGGRAPSGDSVWLLDERDADALRARGVRSRHQVSRRHPRAGSVTEDQRGSWLIDGLQVDLRRAVRGVDSERLHAGHAGRLDSFVSACQAHADARVGILRCRR